MSPASAQTDPQDSPPATGGSHLPTRIRSAIAVLRGEALVPMQIRAEWAEYQLVFSDLLTRLSAMLARQAKAEKKRAARLAETAAEMTNGAHPQPQVQLSPKERKAALRRRAFGQGPPVPPAQPAFHFSPETDE